MFLAVALSLVILLGVSAAWADGCFTIVVGKDASADGYVMVAHNEDDAAPQIVNHYKVPRLKHQPGEKVKLLNGGEIDQVGETWSYIWSEMPGLLFSDSYINEWGVCVASDACPSREDNPEFSDGGINKLLRRLVAQRAKTAREGVHIAAQMVERFGYKAWGRTYAICDPEEGWLFCAVGGRHWLARRVPDNEAAAVANTFTVHQVDLSDTNFCLASADIIDYAVSRGWYDTANTFDFAAVYAHPDAASDSSNFCRHWSGLSCIARDPIPLGESLPFSVVPKQKLDVAFLKQVLRNHYEGTELYQINPTTGNPHRASISTVCNEATQTSFIVQLRKNTPLDVGIVYWVCLASPCVSCYLPFHFGIPAFPDGFSGLREQPSMDSYRQKVQAPLDFSVREAFWTFSSFHDKIAGDYADRITEVRTAMNSVESHALTLQAPLEKTAHDLYSADRIKAMTLLANYSYGIYLSAMEAMAGVLME